MRLFLEFGFGADVVSGGELLCARRAGVPADKIVFSGVAKTADEIELAVKEGVLSFNVESPGEIAKIRAAAKSQRRRPRIALRINPDIDAKTHPKIATGLHGTKFGLETYTAYQIAKSLVNDPDLDISGVSCHIGSQMLDLAPLEEAAHLVFSFADSLRSLGINIRSINLGGGLGVPYHPDEVVKAPGIKRYGEMMARLMKNQQGQLIIEPGRALVAESGLLLTKVVEVKRTGKKTFIMVDSGMNDLVRPALYDAYHSIVPVWRRPSGDSEKAGIVKIFSSLIKKHLRSKKSVL
ncbi:MAG: diaminopimelate decarboxylase [Proteobacteria bacterium]|nr:diaminopimelate decarboxylase [Pseudomonadota bacterium]